MTFSHYSGGARAQVQCVGNSQRELRQRQLRVPVGSAAGIVPYQAVVYRDQLTNNDWWTYNGYLQDSYSRGRIRLNGGLRYDWQQSKHLGGCVPANTLLPNLLPAQCEDATMSDAVDRQEDSVVRQLVAALVGNLRPVRHRQDVGARQRVVPTTRRRSRSPTALNGLFTADRADVGSQPVERRVQHHGGRTLLERRQRRSAGAGQRADRRPDQRAARRFDLNTGILNPAGNIVDPSARIARTREAIVGIQHELIQNLAVGVDYIYRKYDRGTTTYTIGYQPGAPGYPLSQIYTGPLTYTDPATGLSRRRTTRSARDASRPSGLGSITMTNPELSGLPRRGLHRDEAIQQPLADAGGR